MFGTQVLKLAPRYFCSTMGQVKNKPEWYTKVLKDQKAVDETSFTFTLDSCKIAE